jgi:cell division protein FtsB
VTLLRRPGAAIATLLILLMGAAFVTQVVPYNQIVESKRQVAEARSELAELESQNADLQADVEALHTDSEIERLAREKLGYVRPGETAYVVLDPPGAPEEPESTEAAPEPVEKTWVDEVWEFITGADVAP